MDRRIGAQLYTVREFCQTEEDFKNTIARLKDMGYSRVQLSGIGDIPAETIKKITDDAGMDIVCTHRPLQEFTEDLPALIKYHQTLNCPMAGLGCMPRENFESLDALFSFIKTMNQVSKVLKENGMVFGYHNHAYEFTRLQGKQIFDYLLEETDPEGFCFIPDVYWIAFAGINPADCLRKIGNRAKVIHFKDLRVSAWSQVTYSEITEGNLDWDSIISACDEIGAGCAVVEQDTCPADPFESLKISYDHLKKKGFY